MSRNLALLSLASVVCILAVGRAQVPSVPAVPSDAPVVTPEPGEVPPGVEPPTPSADAPTEPASPDDAAAVDAKPENAVKSFDTGYPAAWVDALRAVQEPAGPSERLDDTLAAIKKLADGRLCANGPMQHGIVAALRGDRSHQAAFRAALRARADLTASRLNAIPGVSCAPPAAAFYAMPKIELPEGRTDEEYVLGLLRAPGVLCVYGSGFGLPAHEGFLRIVFLASPQELSGVYDAMAEFTGEFLSR